MPQNNRQTGKPAAVVVGVDGSDSAINAVRWAAAHARGTGAELRLIHAARTPGTATVALPVPVSVTGLPPRRPAGPSKRVLAKAAAEAHLYAPDAEVSGDIVPGGAVAALVEASEGAGMLVVGSRGLGRLAGPLAGSVGVQVAAQAQCPTVVVRGEDNPDGPVLVAVDGTETSEPALRFAFAEASCRRTQLVAVHAWTPPVMPVGAGSAVVHAMAVQPAYADFRRAAGELLTERMAPWRDAFPDVEVTEMVLEEGPEAAVAERSKGASLAVVGSRGRGRLSGLLLGSTSQALLATADCPVVVVRES